MKRITALLISAIMLLTFAACKDPFASDLPLEETENNQSETSTFTGRMVIGKNNYLIIDESGLPIRISVEGSIDDFFEGYKTGDKVEVLSSLVAETYPGQAFIYKVKLIENGSINDIPSEVLASLKDLGWVS